MRLAALHSHSTGVATSVAASVFFAAMYYLGAHLAPLTGEQVFGWRIVATLPLTTWWLIHSGQARAVRELLVRARGHIAMFALLPLSAALLGVQLWLFMWAPLNGYGLAVSLGFALLPLGLVLAGRVVFGEKLSRWQQLAAVLAAAGVGWELARAGGGLAWPTWVVVAGYTAYFVLRRRLATDSLAGHWLDMALLAPVAVVAIAWTTSPIGQSPASASHAPYEAIDSATAGSGLLRPTSQEVDLGRGQALSGDHANGWTIVQATPHLWWAVPLLGILSAGGLGFYMLASRLLPLGLFGLLSYLEPILLIAVSWWLGERIAPGQGTMYALIAASVAALVAEGVWHMRRSHTSAARTNGGKHNDLS